MKTRIAGLVLIAMAVVIAVVIFILPKHIPDTYIWRMIFSMSIHSGAGLTIGISISLVGRATIRQSISCSLVGLLIGLLAGLFCLFTPLTIWVIFIAATAIVGLIVSAVVFLINGSKFIFFS